MSNSTLFLISSSTKTKCKTNFLIHVSGRHYGLWYRITFKTHICFVFFDFKMKCHTIGVHLKFSNYPYQPQFVAWGEGETPKYVKNYFRVYPNYLHAVPNRVWQIWLGVGWEGESWSTRPRCNILDSLAADYIILIVFKCQYWIHEKTKFLSYTTLIDNIPTYFWCLLSKEYRFLRLQIR